MLKAVNLNLLQEKVCIINYFYFIKKGFGIFTLCININQNKTLKIKIKNYNNNIFKSVCKIKF
jgi:hypothetical protein